MAIVTGGAPRLHVDSDGDGPPTLVLGHGFGGSARNFGGQVRGLRDRARIVRFDARGHARSDAPADPAAYGLDAFVDDLRRVLDGAGAADAVVGGLSMGAAVALRFACVYPQRVRGLVLASFPAGRGVPGSLSSVADAFADAIEHDGLDAAGGRFVWGPESNLDARGAALVRQGFLEHAPHALAATLRHFLAAQPSADELAGALGALAVPTLVVAGANDASSLAASRIIAAAIPDARLEVIAHAGHLVNVAQPDAFNAALAAFLDRLPAQSTSGR